MFKYAKLALAMILVAGTATTAFGQGNRPAGQPNSRKYSDTGVKPATGRAGSATLSARALLSKGGGLQIEASTGNLEEGTNAGNIDKVQLKFENATAATNYNNLTAGGYWTRSFTGVSRGASIQLQANIKGIDPKRTGVVTVTTAAALRPDIAVLSVAGPAQVTPQSNVAFLATVTEKNGDVGARTNCVLSVNGAAVDSATGIWVDAAGTVTCAFDHVFATPGSYTVKVTASGVNPGDFDTDNNSAQTSIVVVEPGRRFQGGYMGAVHVDYQQTSAAQSTSGPQYSYTSNYTYNYSYATSFGWINAPAAALQRVDASLYANGAIEHNISLTPNNGYDYNNGSYYSHCRKFDNWTEANDGTGRIYTSSGDWMQMCTAGEVANPSNVNTWAHYQRATGKITYFAQGSDAYYGNTWLYNQRNTYGTGSSLNWTAGTEVRLKLSFVDEAGQALTMNEAVILNDYSAQVNYMYSGTSNDYYLGRTIDYVNKAVGVYYPGWKNW